MKSSFPLFVILLLISSITLFSQSPNSTGMQWLNGWSDFDPNNEDYPDPEEQLSNIISTDTYLTNDTTYLLSGNVYVTNGATLNIQEGTIIRCSVDNPASLLITKGSKLMAIGTKIAPIVFTSANNVKSRKPGDWGGIIIAGASKVNSPSGMGVIEGDFLPQYSVYGGDEDLGEVGTTSIMTYVRIEYPGRKINQSKELNGLSLCAVGNSTIISNVMVSYSADDSFEWFGGAVHASNLISYKAKDDDYDFTMGYQGELYNILAIRHPYISDASGSYSIEVDGYDKKISKSAAPDSHSSVAISDATFINLTNKDNYQHTASAIFAKNSAKLDISNSRISGYINVVKFDKSYQSYNDLVAQFKLENNVINVVKKVVFVEYEQKQSAHKIIQYNMLTKHFKNADEMFTDPHNEQNPKFTLKSRDNFMVMD